MANKNAAFTLIELSIVLVIIGLIVGGVLVGRDMIEAAAVRAQVSQFAKYDAAVNTFRGKYNGLPGDLRSDLAASMGFVTRTGASCDGDGDGIVCGGDPAHFVGEIELFWNDLGVANLIDGSFPLDVDSGYTLNFTAQQASQYMPAAKIGNGNVVAIFSHATIPKPCQNNFCYSVMKLGASSSQYYPWSGSTAGVTPLQAFAIDSKMDDGLPSTGIVQSSDVYILFGSAVFASAQSVGVTGNCLASPSAGNYIYNINSTLSSQPVCVLNVVRQ